MSGSRLHLVDRQGIENDIDIAQVRELKRGLVKALTNRDWAQVLRIDRLSSQVVKNICPTNRQSMEESISELLDIKALYRQSLNLLEQEIINLSDQVY